jgi:hypothetical protein
LFTYHLFLLAGPLARTRLRYRLRFFRKALRSPEQIALGDDISVRLAGGQLDATVLRKRKTED